MNTTTATETDNKFEGIHEGARVNVTQYDNQRMHELCGPATVRDVTRGAHDCVLGFYFSPDVPPADDPDAQGFCTADDEWTRASVRPAPAEQLNAAGNRMNVGKTKWTLTLRRMWPALREVARVTEMGAKKYAPDGWWNTELAEDDTCDAVVRHAMAVLSDIYIDHHGEMHVGQNDPESGLPHWAHGAWNLLALGALRIKNANRANFDAARELGK